MNKDIETVRELGDKFMNIGQAADARKAYDIADRMEAQSKAEPIATTQLPSPESIGKGIWFTLSDMDKLSRLPVGTKLYDYPPADVSQANSRDAERYRYMRSNAAFQDRNGPGLYWYLERLNRDLPIGQRLDSAIDAAIAAREGK